MPAVKAPAEKIAIPAAAVIKNFRMKYSVM
jgi:hypothetical protein